MPLSKDGNCGGFAGRLLLPLLLLLLLLLLRLGEGGEAEGGGGGEGGARLLLVAIACVCLDGAGARGQLGLRQEAKLAGRQACEGGPGGAGWGLRARRPVEATRRELESRHGGLS